MKKLLPPTLFLRIMLQKSFNAATVVVILVFFGVLGYWQYSRAPSSESQVSVLPLVGCDLNKAPCTADLPGGGKARFEISPRPIPALKPLDIQVSLENYEASSIWLDFLGIDMEMGFNRIILKEEEPGKFRGQGALPVCMTGKMRWRANFTLINPQTSLSAPLQFEVDPKEQAHHDHP